MGEEEIVVIGGLVLGLVLAGYELLTRMRLKSLRKHVLQEMLADSKYEWRSLPRLARSIGLDDQSTKELLVGIGAKPDANGKDLWKSN